MICNECENNTFDEEEDGFFYCTQCSTQANDIIQTIDEDEAAVDNVIHRRPKVKPNLEPMNLSYEDYYKETRDRYVKGLLMMITYQCDALVEKFNVTPLIIGLVGPICLRFVSLSGVFDDDWADKAIHDSEIQSKGEVREVEVKRRKDEEPRNLYGKRAVTIWLSQLKKSLPLSTSLAISFLACHVARSPVLPMDIVRWAREEKIPYRSCFDKIRKEMGERSVLCPVSASVMFRPIHIVSAQRLEAQAGLIADVIGVHLPPVNVYGIASNYLKRLSIPEDDKVLDLVCLIQNWSMSSDLYLSKNELKLPTRVSVMSIVIVAIRMLYNINGFGVWERSLGLVDAEKETEFDTEELLKNLETRYYEVAADQTVEYEKDLLSYILHGNEMFAGLEEASADDTYRTVDNLWNIYSKDEEFERFETPSKRGRDWEDYLSLNQLSLNDDELRDGNNPCKTESMDCDEPSLECVSPPQEEKSKEKVIRRLITNMKENLFCYIPPRVKVKRLDYLQYVRKKDNGALIYAVHADYYILLRVCTLVAEIDARNMHRSVLSFERRLNWIENRIDHVLHP